MGCPKMWRPLFMDCFFCFLRESLLTWSKMDDDLGGSPIVGNSQIKAINQSSTNRCWEVSWNHYLVGGLVAIFYFPIYWVSNLMFISASQGLEIMFFFFFFIFFHFDHHFFGLKTIIPFLFRSSFFIFFTPVFIPLAFSFSWFPVIWAAVCPT